MSIAPDPEAFLALTERLVQDDPRLSSLGAAMLAALKMDIAHDSRSFSNRFGVAHALVLRELNALDDAGGRIRLLSRDERTMRSRYALAV